MVATPDFGGETYDDSESLTGSDNALGLVDFSVPAYAIDDDTAITVVDGAVEVVSEGHWKLFTPARRQASRLRRRARRSRGPAFGNDA